MLTPSTLMVMAQDGTKEVPGDPRSRLRPEMGEQGSSYHTSFTILRKDGLNTFFSVIRTGDAKHLTQSSTTHSSQNANNANIHQLMNGETKGDIPLQWYPILSKNG